MRIISLGVVSLALVACLACGQRLVNPATAVSSNAADRFLRLPTKVPESENLGSSLVVPFGRRVPAGTPITVRLLQPISSASARVGQTFEGVMDDNIVLDGQILVERGARVRGRVVESSARRVNHSPGYLRLALAEIAIDGRTRVLRTYTDFFKGPGSTRRSMANSFPGERLVAETQVLSRVPGTDEDGDSPEIIVPPKASDVHLGVDRRLTFRLLEPLSLGMP